MQVFAVGTFFAYLGGAPFVGDKFFDLSASQVGLYLALTPLGYMLGAGISGRFASRIGLYRMIVVGALITLMGMSMALVTVSLGVAHPMGFFGFTIFIGLGNGLILPSANAGMLDVKPELAGSASGLGGSLMTFGGASLSALSGFVLTETSGVYPLIYCILGAYILCLLATIYTIKVEIEMRGTN
jgi:DHA1 family bicyclomycin/chloramphenicol resistance-like MFS transporter